MEEVLSERRHRVAQHNLTGSSRELCAALRIVLPKELCWGNAFSVRVCVCVRMPKKGFFFYLWKCDLRGARILFMG